MGQRRRSLEHSDDGNKKKNSGKEKHNDLRPDLRQVRGNGRALSSQSACRVVIGAGAATMKRESNERMGMAETVAVSGR
jgi:hypothetical protein